jgi:hypothetical protein
MPELPPNESSIAGADAGRRKAAAHEARDAQTFAVTSRRKRNVARKILLKSRQRLLWLWPQYFPKHDVVTGRLQTDRADTLEREADLAEAELRGPQPGSRARQESHQFFKESEAACDDPVCAREHLDEQKTQPGDYWSDPGWRRAARQYQTARGRRTLVTEMPPHRLSRLRELLADEISLDRAWRELNDDGNQPAPQVTLDALIYELRMDGLAALEKPNCRRRLADLSDDQLREVLAALIRARTNCAAVTDELLVALDEIRR